MGTRVVSYVNAFFWDSDTESYYIENAEQGAVRLETGEVQFMGYSGQRIATMCPGPALWRDKLTEVCKELVGRYRVDGIYLDFLTVHGMDCFNPEHGHPLGGGNYWTKSVRELYGHIRHELKQINPEVILTGERTAEYVIDLLDAPLSQETVGATPMFQAVYHGYALAYGGQTNNSEPHSLGRWWLMGNQNGWNQTEPGLAKALNGDPEYQDRVQHAQYYVKLLRCHYHFGQPYLAYGEMLRPPRIDGDLPTVTGQTGYGSYTVPVVEGSARRAPDGSVGVFFLNYDKEQSHEFSWTVDLREGAGWGRHTRLKLCQWTEERGLEYVEEVPGGRLTRRATIEPWGLIALRIEVIK